MSELKDTNGNVEEFAGNGVEMAPDGTFRAARGMEGWVIALAAGKTLLGKLAHFFTGNSETQVRVLDPVYELAIVQVQIPQQVRGPNGPEIQIVLQARRQIGRISNFNSWTSVTLPPDAIVKPVAEFDAVERAMLTKFVADAEVAFEQMARQEKAAAMAKEAAVLKPFGGGPRTEES